MVMATKRLTVRNIREILRLGLGAQLTLRQIHSSTKSSVIVDPTVKTVNQQI